MMAAVMIPAWEMTFVTKHSQNHNELKPFQLNLHIVINANGTLKHFQVTANSTPQHPFKLAKEKGVNSHQ